MSEHITEKASVRRLERSRTDRKVAGVCGGLARYFDLSPALYRVGFVVLTLLGGAGILVYAAAALVIPEEGEDESIAAEILRNRREKPWQLFALALVAVGGAVLLSRATLWPHGDAAWVLVLLAGAVLLWTQRRGRTAERPSPGTLPGTVTGTEAVATAAPARRKRRIGRVIAIVATTLVVLVLAVTAIVATSFHVSVGDGIGERTYQPSTPENLKHKYRLGIGHLRLELGSLRVPPGETHIDARVGMGQLDVTVPRNVAVRITGRAQIGNVHVLGEGQDGRNAKVTATTAGRRVLVVDARVGFGTVHVNRSVR
jgi:phage shock protein PspC (stress-responsive transcriptional regulator)